MLGHTISQTTQIFARITNDKISKDMQGLSEKFTDSEGWFDQSEIVIEVLIMRK